MSADLADFLLARIAEDERDLDLIGEKRKDWHARWLAECQAKRMMLELHGPHGRDVYELPCRELAVLAYPYADHPDYRKEWRP